MSRHFCCCIPVRFGVFVFSLFQFLVEGLWAAILWYSLHRESRAFLTSMRPAELLFSRDHRPDCERR
ncbi:uncharacterized protein PHACADRAFT_259499 [Phanerochaete carnosa HHB-10118-sp]|uniref:Uncharacterized protein n=1 Tax=Phanerochaete carnosa (strain HHB-10118-sp) TaxID=650164 RepID=K5W2D3_PHACS|nr:uncharacterized protein PHACADRAFT_259499 [Phanerochaete carnosa HHB-10118-sp]EKM53270.1 hypothetical protein PHACADRAFT_259499 [Phanerochaete carnosa HHB-10118-sp]